MGKPWENGDLYGKSLLLVGKSTISMAIFNSYVTNYQRLLIRIDLYQDLLNKLHKHLVPLMLDIPIFALIEINI